MVITSRTRNAVVLFGRVGSNPTLSANTKGAVDMSMAPFKSPYEMIPLWCVSAHPLRASLAACFQCDACDTVLDHVADGVLCVEGHVR